MINDSTWNIATFHRDGGAAPGRSSRRGEESASREAEIHVPAGLCPVPPEGHKRCGRSHGQEQTSSFSHAGVRRETQQHRRETLRVARNGWGHWVDGTGRGAPRKAKQGSPSGCQEGDSRDQTSCQGTARVRPALRLREAVRLGWRWVTEGGETLRPGHAGSGDHSGVWARPWVLSVHVGRF